MKSTGRFCGIDGKLVWLNGKGFLKVPAVSL